MYLFEHAQNPCDLEKSKEMRTPVNVSRHIGKSLSNVCILALTWYFNLFFF